VKAQGLLDEVGADSDGVKEDPETEVLRRMYYICLNNLASLQLEMEPPQTNEALSNIDRALSNLPDSLKAAAHKTRSEVMLKTGQCDQAIKDMEKAVLLEQAMDAAVEYRIELIELMMTCLYEERAISEAIELREYIYGSPRPDLDRVRRLDSLIEKGS
jgi:tetratricopeptide (TPR) repeat protein